jgi:hypothetical protein
VVTAASKSAIKKQAPSSSTTMVTTPDTTQYHNPTITIYINSVDYVLDNLLTVSTAMVLYVYIVLNKVEGSYGEPG